MNYWIFRCNPEKYDIDRRLQDPERNITWQVSRYRKEIMNGDIAFIWKGGKNPGICAIMEIESDPHEMAEIESEHEYCLDLSTDLEVRVIGRFRDQIPLLSKVDILEDPITSELSIFKFNQATNYEMTVKQAEKIFEMIGRT